MLRKGTGEAGNVGEGKKMIMGGGGRSHSLFLGSQCILRLQGAGEGAGKSGSKEKRRKCDMVADVGVVCEKSGNRSHLLHNLLGTRPDSRFPGGGKRDEKGGSGCRKFGGEFIYGPRKDGWGRGRGRGNLSV